LAAVAVSSAAMAQVTVSGKLRFAYEATDGTAINETKTETNGLRVTDGDFVLTASEDLGQGMKATATMHVLSRGRDTSISGRDASITLSGGFGSVTVGAVEAGNGIIGLGGAGAPVYGMDGWSLTCDGVKDFVAYMTEADGSTLEKARASNLSSCGVIDGGSNVNILSYTSPSFNGITFTANMTDSTSAGGMEDASKAADGKTVGVRYSAGPLAAALDTTRQSQNSATDLTTKSRTRLSASYDLGVAKLGFGYQTRKSFEADADTNKQTLVGVSVPMGAITLGMNYAIHKEGDIKGTGTDLGAKYDLSKRTYVAFHYQNVKYKFDGESLGKNDKYRMQVAHSF